jgi:16S rRNA (guanine966-N2)-methyltransferase
MRIVGGRFRGRALKGPSSQAVRPTSDRLRETVFNILAHAYDDAVDGARVVDLFAGTGALGLEALSRGATFSLFVDDSAEGRALLRDNIETLGVAGLSKVFRRDATKLGAMPPQPGFTLAFLDPPYGKGLGERALASLRDGGWLAPGALCLLEESGTAQIAVPEGFALIESRDYGEAQVVFLRAGEDASIRQAARE